jgi:metal-sulfur cluster biosynthetic enzyme
MALVIKIIICVVAVIEELERAVAVFATASVWGCGMGDILQDDARRKIETLPGVSEVDVERVSDPPWDMSRMSEAARLQLGMW